LPEPKRLGAEVSVKHPQGSNATCGDKTVISGLCWYAADRYGRVGLKVGIHQNLRNPVSFIGL